MTDPELAAETLEEFAQSLSYGERSDLSFKFLARLGGPRIGDSLAQMLEAIGALFDTGDPMDLIELATRLQAEGYQSRPLTERYRYDEGPFTRSERPVAESQVALSEIPVSSSADVIEVRHGGYDIRGSLTDHNVSLPLGRLRELEQEGIIGSLHEVAYSFVGACAQTRLINHTAPDWADRLKSTGSDVVLLIPV